MNIPRSCSPGNAPLARRSSFWPQILSLSPLQRFDSPFFRVLLLRRLHLPLPLNCLGHQRARFLGGEALHWSVLWFGSATPTPEFPLGFLFSPGSVGDRRHVGVTSFFARRWQMSRQTGRLPLRFLEEAKTRSLLLLLWHSCLPCCISTTTWAPMVTRLLDVGVIVLLFAWATC